MRTITLLLIAFLICSTSYAKTLDEMNANTSPDITSDLIYSQDVSDTTENSRGTGKSLTIKNAFKAANITVDGTNVGINSVNPTSTLDVGGTINATAFTGDGSGLTGVSSTASDTAYGPSWDGDTTGIASKNALYDKIETIGSGSVSDNAYGSGWNGDTTVAPSKNAVYDKIETINASVGDYYNVVSYGATGDGTTDDTAAIQDAIDAAHTASGGTVYFPRGTYSTSDLTYYDDVSLLGENREASILKARAGTVNILYWTNLLTDTFTPLYTYIRDLQFDGNSVAGVTGIRLLNSPFFTLEDIRIHHCDIGLYATGNYLANITGSRFTFNRVGIYFDVATIPSSVNLPQEIVISHSSITANTEWGLKAKYISSLILTGIDVEQNGTSGDSTTGGIKMESLNGHPTAGAGGVGLVVKDAWFEANHGQADIWIDSTVASGRISLVVDSSSFHTYTNTGTRATYYIYSPNALGSVTASNTWFDGSINNYVVGEYRTINVSATNNDNAYRPDIVSATGTHNGYMSQIPSTKHMFLIDTQSSSSTSGAAVNLMSTDKSALASGDRLGALNFLGSTSSTTSEFSSRIQSFADGNWGTGDAPSKITFDTVPSGGTTRTERMTIRSDGNVGIATINPISTLQVIGTVTATAFVGDGSGLTGISGSGSGGWTDGGTNVYLTTTTDKVGIGTTTPNATSLEIVKQSSTIPLKISSSASGNGDYLTITSSGNVGIGSTSPTQQIVVVRAATNNVLGLVNSSSSGSGAGAGAQFISDDNAALANGDRAGFVVFGGSADTADTIVNGAGITAFATGTLSSTSAPMELRFETAPSGSTTRSTRMVIQSNGNVGIGTFSATGILDARGDEVRIWTGSGTNTNALSSGELYVEGDLEVDGTAYFGGNVGIGTANPRGPLDLGPTGTAYFKTWDAGGTTAVGIGTSLPRSILEIQKGTGTAQITIDGTTGGCLMFQDTDGAGWTECDALNGSLSCSTDADGICD